MPRKGEKLSAEHLAKLQAGRRAKKGGGQATAPGVPEDGDRLANNRPLVQPKEATKPLISQQIELGGTLNGLTISEMTLSGLATAYGQAGFEFPLSDHPIASTQTVWIQVFDISSKPLTDKIFFDTYSTCTQNLVMAVLTKTR